MLTDRQIRGMAIIAKGEMPKQIDENIFRIPSQNGNGNYKVWTEIKEYWIGKKINRYTVWRCDCPDYQYCCSKDESECKHISAIKFWLDLKKNHMPEAMPQIINPIPTYNAMECIYCGSGDIRKDGRRKTRHGVKQRMECKVCERKFTLDADFGKLSTNPEVIGVVLDLYFKGISLRKIKDHLKQFYQMEVDHSTIYRWIRKYTKQIHQFTKSLTPQTGKTWHSDEMAVKVGKEWKWQWNLLDRDSRFLLASRVTNERPIGDAEVLLIEGKERAKKKPDFLMTDGLHSYIKASEKHLGHDGFRHIRCATLRSKSNNNMVERYNNTMRERDKVMRGYKKDESAEALIDGFSDYYNFIREHQGLGTTPAEKAGIGLELDRNKWMSLLKKSVQHRKRKIKTY